MAFNFCYVMRMEDPNSIEYYPDFPYTSQMTCALSNAIKCLQNFKYMKWLIHNLILNIYLNFFQINLEHHPALE